MFCIFSVIISQEIKYSMDPVSCRDQRVITQESCSYKRCVWFMPYLPQWPGSLLEALWLTLSWHKKRTVFYAWENFPFRRPLDICGPAHNCPSSLVLICGIIHVNVNCKENKRKTNPCFMCPRATSGQSILGLMRQNKKLGSGLFIQDKWSKTEIERSLTIHWKALCKFALHVS